MGERSAEAASEQTIRAWIEREIGPVRSLVREGRWRPAWFAEAETAAGIQPLYVRGDRGGRWPPRPLAYEARAHRILEENGLRVPHLFGYIAEVPAMVMARVPGRPNLASATSDEDRARLRIQLADQMRRMHDLDPAPFRAAGAPWPATPADTSLSAYREVERIYLSGDRLPSPDIEFVRRWIDRNVPPASEPPRVIAMDAGQFIFEGDELTALLDFEFLCLGDRHTDFAALRTRERIEGFDDPEGFYRLYEERGGAPIDIDRVRFHHVAFSLFTPLEIAHDLARPLEAADYHEYLIWHTISIKDALEGMAEVMGLALEPCPLPPPAASRFAPSLAAIAGTVAAISHADDLDGYRIDKAGLALRYLQRAEAYRDAFGAAYVDDVAALTGRRAPSESAAAEALETFVVAAGPDDDEALLRLLHRQVQRDAAILADEGTWLYRSLSTPLRPLTDASRRI